ncbi:lipoprotein-anchoring transpeptidase ErfK/SrfK [Hoeflea marina]|uniref:Lipoprotein-anchoring transpeptidase ErfK/SrfK n=1 Tax=Hoeflea marina TaxID=274592 RepID=A0A317PK29_9HYPH|nr:lipoprotein-anchoring transpeptidase ErfK/SrfK [Hoeflea marina]
MSGLRIARTTALLLAASMLATTLPAAAQWREGDTVLVSPDGRLIRDMPELGTVRIVADEFGRNLLINDWNEVVAIEMSARDYQRSYGGVGLENETFGNDSADAFPEPPAPMQPGSDDGYDAASIDRGNLDPITGTVPDEQQPAAQDIPGAIQAYPDQGQPQQKNVQQQPVWPKISKPQVVALQVFLDRNGMSPGVIDGRLGGNVAKALSAWKEATGETLDPADTDTVMQRLAAGEGLAFGSYTITAEDAAGPYVASIPTDYAEKAKLERMAFTSTVEMLAERFHMDEAYLKEINPDADFTRQGTIIKVAIPGKARTGVVASIVADKGRKQVRAYDEAGKLVAAYPATIGSSDTPSPSGMVEVKRIAPDPGYTYNPKVNFKQGENDKVLEVPPGPNGPVGTMWIALSRPTYGIHGTPEPSAIGKTESHGCVRLTNWDAGELAKMVKPGVTVAFEE